VRHNSTKNTDWNKFEDIINSNIKLNIKLKEQIDIDEAIQYWTTLIQNAAWYATPAANIPNNRITMYLCILVKWSWKNEEHAESGKHHEIYRTKVT
jgi:hypothetical protein